MSKILEQLFTEKFRPKKVEDIILAPRIKSAIGQGVIQQHLLLVGSQGMGKTSTAKAIASKFPNMYINVSDESSVDVIREKIKGYCERISVLDGEDSIKIVILDEIDGASDQFYKALRGVMEDVRYVSKVRFIGTANYINKIPDPVRSRFFILDFNPATKEEEIGLMKDQAKRIAFLLKSLNIEFENDALKEFIKRNFPDMRAMINKIQNWQTSGKNKITLNEIKDLNYSFNDLFELLTIKDTNPIQNYKYIVKNCSNKVDDVLMSLHSDFPLWISENKPDMINKIPMVLVLVGKWQADKHACIDPIVALTGCFFEIHMHMKS
jgi:DNA polymerase III delta prime subunit